MDMNNQQNSPGMFGGFIEMVTALKNLVISANTINQTLAKYLPAGSSIVNVEGTNTPAGTTGNQTINKPGGSVNFAAASFLITVTDSLCSPSSIVIPALQTIDATLTDVWAIPGSGSFTLIGNAAATAETRCGFLVINFV